MIKKIKRKKIRKRKKPVVTPDKVKMPPGVIKNNNPKPAQVRF